MKLCNWSHSYLGRLGYQTCCKLGNFFFFIKFIVFWRPYVWGSKLYPFSSLLDRRFNPIMLQSLNVICTRTRSICMSLHSIGKCYVSWARPGYVTPDLIDSHRLHWNRDCNVNMGIIFPFVTVRWLLLLSSTVSV